MDKNQFVKPNIADCLGITDDLSPDRSLNTLIPLGPTGKIPEVFKSRTGPPAYSAIKQYNPGQPCEGCIFYAGIPADELQIEKVCTNEIVGLMRAKTGPYKN